MNKQEIKQLQNEALEIAALKMLDIIAELRKAKLDDSKAVEKYKQFWSMII